MRKNCLAVLLYFISAACFAQGDSARLRVSLLTCAPGDELYSSFGHTALRIVDSSQHTDLVFNYGTFNFDDPDFYTKFVKGKLDYFLSVTDYPAFLYEYQVTHRDVTEQVLHLANKQSAAIYDALRINMQGNNRYYKYDFLRDNCTTRVRNLLLNYGGMSVNHPIVSEGTSFRDLIHEYLDRSNMDWTKLGIDILMGKPADKSLSIRESMFLPDYLMKGVDSAENFVAGRHVLPYSEKQNTNHTPWPLITMSIICALILLVSFSNNNKAKAFTRVMDISLYIITGLVGCLLLFTWFGTDHASFKSNYNLFWALPTNLPAALLLAGRPAKAKRYFLAASVVYGLLLVTWYWLPQQLNLALAPLVLLLFLRSVQQIKK